MVRKRRVAVHRAQVPGRIVHAVPGLADAAHDLAPAQLEHPAVVGVGDDHEVVRQRVGVVGRVEVPGRGAGDAGMAVAPDQLPAGVGDLDDLVVLLLVRDDPAARRARRTCRRRSTGAPDRAGWGTSTGSCGRGSRSACGCSRDRRSAGLPAAAPGTSRAAGAPRPVLAAAAARTCSYAGAIRCPPAPGRPIRRRPPARPESSPPRRRRAAGRDGARGARGPRDRSPAPSWWVCRPRSARRRRRRSRRSLRPRRA